MAHWTITTAFFYIPALVDRTLESDDTDGDGFVSYAEYRAARVNYPSTRTPRVVAAVSP